jgi:hypothetical protein
MKVPQIHYQSENILIYKVPSKSRPGTTQITEYGPGQKRDCTCEGTEWFKVRQQGHMKMCRHQKMTTIAPREGCVAVFEEVLNRSIRLCRTKNSTLDFVWPYMQDCSEPTRWDEYTIECKGCPMYERNICNIHKIKRKDRRNRLPLLWKLQGAVYRGKREQALKILLKIKKEIRQ